MVVLFIIKLNNLSKKIFIYQIEFKEIEQIITNKILEIKLNVLFLLSFFFLKKKNYLTN